jgi:hypothetical protein
MLIGSMPRPAEGNRSLANPARFAAMAMKRWHRNHAASALTASPWAHHSHQFSRQIAPLFGCYGALRRLRRAFRDRERGDERAPGH